MIGKSLFLFIIGFKAIFVMTLGLTQFHYKIITGKKKIILSSNVEIAHIRSPDLDLSLIDLR